MQLPQESVPVNPESQQPPTSENNPPPLKDAPVHAGTPWPRAGKMSSNLFKIRKDWPVPPSTNTSPNITIKPNPPTIKTEPRTQISQNPVQLQQSQREMDGDQSAPFFKNAQEVWQEHQKQLQQSDAQQKYPPQG